MANTTMTDSPEHLALILARGTTPMDDAKMSGETPDDDAVPEGMVEAMSRFADAHKADDHLGMAAALRDAITHHNEPIIEDAESEA